ncbi:hypothetical protein GX51_07512 [Blastomyces parvus]|uniref:Extracellular membrane protein CFEM domain-containing protein n=1 Tax=Blastomyces parvus TaxID=2060905 RepID=A0A2B7WKK0_9EURO|nr:hypothetical protein GX51_07512 [Blastomyces parvus]
MFASKFVFFAALLALFNAVMAVPPGCLIGAVNTQKNPLDFKTICADEDVQREIVKMCPDNVVKDALKEFSNSCAEAGQKISLIDINKPSGTSPGGSNGGGDDDEDGNGNGGNPTSNSPEPSSTDNAAGTHIVDSFTVAAVVALVGLVSTM